MSFKDGRKFLKFFDADEYDKVVPKSDQSKEMERPAQQKSYPNDAQLIDLTQPNDFSIGNRSFLETINNRKSRRKFKDESISLEELSFLLWCTQGVKKQTKFGMFRTVPSAGARNPFETYLFINNVESLKKGIYRYLSLEHKLLFVKEIENPEEYFTELAYGQPFAGHCAVLFIWTALPYRTEWRYTTLAHKFIAIDLGMVDENLYLACEAINLGTVAIGYYEQDKFDKLLEIDGEEEFVVLIAPVGKTITRLSVKDFLKNPKSNVSEEEMKKLTTVFTREGVPEDIPIIFEDGQLIMRTNSFEEKLTAHNALEYIGGDLIRAIRFNLNENGNVKNAEFLMGILSSTDVLEFSVKE